MPVANGSLRGKAALLSCVASLLLGGLPARAEDSLWDKAVNAVGMGDAKPAPAQPQAAQPAPDPAQKTKKKQKPVAAAAAVEPSSLDLPAKPGAKPAKPQAPAQAQAAPQAQPQAAAEPDRPRGLINQFMNPTPAEIAADKAEEGQPPRGVINRMFSDDPAPVRPQAAAQPPAAAAQQSSAAAPAQRGEPSVWRKPADALGLTAPSVASTIDYSERPKLKVPGSPDLPPPAPMPERQVNNIDETTLTKPKGDLLEKVRGADGQVSGFRDGDEGKKKFLNFF